MEIYLSRGFLLWVSGNAFPFHIYFDTRSLVPVLYTIRNFGTIHIVCPVVPVPSASSSSVRPSVPLSSYVICPSAPSCPSRRRRRRPLSVRPVVRPCPVVVVRPQPVGSIVLPIVVRPLSARPVVRPPPSVPSTSRSIRSMPDIAAKNLIV